MIVSIKSPLLLFCILLTAASLAQTDGVEGGYELEMKGALYTAREIYKNALNDSTAHISGVYLNLARLEYKAGNEKQAVRYWKMAIESDSTSAPAVAANLNLAAVSAVSARGAQLEKVARNYNYLDTLELRYAQSADRNYRALLNRQDYIEFPFYNYLIPYVRSRNREKVEALIKEMMVSSSRKGNTKDHWEWYLLKLNAASSVRELNFGRYTGVSEADYSQSELRKERLMDNQVNDITIRFQDILDRAEEKALPPEFVVNVHIEFAKYLEALNRLNSQKLKYYAIRSDSIAGNPDFELLLSNLLDLDKEIMTHYQRAIMLSFPKVEIDSSFKTPKEIEFSNEALTFTGREALIGKARYLLSLNWRRYSYTSFTWPWTKQFKKLGFRGAISEVTYASSGNVDIIKKTGNQSNFKKKALKLALETITMNEKFVEHISSQLEAEKDRFEWTVTAYDEKILGIDVAYEYFHVNPVGAKSSGSRSTDKTASSMKYVVANSVRKSPLYDVFYFAEKAKAALLMKDLINRNSEEGLEMGPVATLKQIRERLDNNTALIEYVISPHNYYQFTITQDYLELKTRTIDEEDIRPHIRALRNGMIYQDDNIFLESARYLHKKLIPKLDDNITDLVIVPDNELALIPFEVLTSKKVKKKEMGNRSVYPFLVKEYNISYSFSASLWQYKLTDPPENPSLLAFAPVFSDSEKSEMTTATREVLLDFNEEDATRAILKDGSYVAPLPGTEMEVEAISGLFEKAGLEATLYTHATASEELFKSTAVKSEHFLHLATHGFVNTSDPDRSGVLFSQENTEEDGVLFVNEIINKNIDAYLISLSACETSIGKVIKGEGVIGLSRAFLVAGASNVMASLWKVSDESTALLMTYFYDFLISANLPMNEALQKAKIKLIGNPKFAAPFYWSPFVLVGN